MTRKDPLPAGQLAPNLESPTVASMSRPQTKEAPPGEAFGQSSLTVFADSPTTVAGNILVPPAPALGAAQARLRAPPVQRLVESPPRTDETELAFGVYPAQRVGGRSPVDRPLELAATAPVDFSRHAVGPQGSCGSQVLTTLRSRRLSEVRPEAATSSRESRAACASPPSWRDDPVGSPGIQPGVGRRRSAPIRALRHRHGTLRFRVATRARHEPLRHAARYTPSAPQNSCLACLHSFYRAPDA